VLGVTAAGLAYALRRSSALGWRRCTSTSSNDIRRRHRANSLPSRIRAYASAWACWYPWDLPVWCGVPTRKRVVDYLFQLWIGGTITTTATAGGWLPSSPSPCWRSRDDAYWWHMVAYKSVYGESPGRSGPEGPGLVTGRHLRGWTRRCRRSATPAGFGNPNKTGAVARTWTAS